MSGDTVLKQPLFQDMEGQRDRRLKVASDEVKQCLNWLNPILRSLRTIYAGSTYDIPEAYSHDFKRLTWWSGTDTIKLVKYLSICQDGIDESMFINQKAARIRITQCLQKIN